MAQPPYLFKYSGNKRKIVPLLATLPSFKRSVELYLGAGSFVCVQKGPALGVDINPDIIDLWTWLQNEATETRLRELAAIAADAVSKAEDKKPDSRLLGLSRGELLYVRVNITGAYCGQLSSWKIYPQYKLPIDQTLKLMPRLKDIELRCGNASEYVEVDGDLVFLDPPYAKTKANYKQGGKNGIEEGYKPADTIALIRRLSCPIIFTYGTDAPEVFPEFDWKVVLKKKVPNLRRGGTVERTEHVSYINWKEEINTVSEESCAQGT